MWPAWKCFAAKHCGVSFATHLRHGTPSVHKKLKKSRLPGNIFWYSASKKRASISSSPDGRAWRHDGMGSNPQSRTMDTHELRPFTFISLFKRVRLVPLLSFHLSKKSVCCVPLLLFYLSKSYVCRVPLFISFVKYMCGVHLLSFRLWNACVASPYFHLTCEMHFIYFICQN